MKRIPFDEVARTLSGVLEKLGMKPERAATCARLFAETTCDGVYTHGINRFPRLVKMIRSSVVDVKAEAERVAGLGALEQWDGHGGMGNLNAWASMGRAIELAGEHGIGCVALRNTNHWMRAGTYGWQAADAGMIGICWTNTLPNLPAWGGRSPAVGNNPLVLAVPRAAGHLVLDMAMSQFSYGALDAYRRRGAMLPVDGGFDEAGNLTRDPGAIERTLRPLPVGFWKGSGLAALLDAIAATMAMGKATHMLSTDPLRETAISQMFVAMNPLALGSAEEAARIADGVVESLHSSVPASEGEQVRYPGEQVVKVRAENNRLGLPVEEAVWDKILAM